MNKSEQNLLKVSLSIYITLVIMNSIKFIGEITMIGSIGKLLFCLVFIGSVLLFVNKEKYKIQFLLVKEWIIIIATILIFNFWFIFYDGNRANLLPNLALPIYLIFYYVVIKLFIRAQRVKNIAGVAQIVLYRILLIFRKVLFVNCLFWFPLSIAAGANMFEIDGGFGGFIEDEIHFGFYVVTGFLISFYFRYNDLKKDTSLYNTFLLLMYGGIALFTSRNAFLILLIAVFYYFVISLVKTKFYRVLLSALTLIGTGIGIITSDISELELIEFTSGRYQIWLFAIEDMINKNMLLIGNGFFNLNDNILARYKNTGFYYFDDLEKLSFHSSYIEILTAGGIIALFYFFRVLNKTWKRLSRVEKSIIIGISTGAFFESFLVQPFMLIASLFYMILIVHNVMIKVSKKVKTDATLERDITYTNYISTNN